MEPRRHKRNRGPSLWLMLVTASLFFAIVGAIFRNGAYSRYALKPWSEPVLSLVMEGLHDGVYPWTAAAAETEAPPEPEAPPETSSPDDFIGPPAPAPQPTTYEFKTVEQSYYDDVLFLGDSRMVGMRDYSSLKNATYYCSEGLSVFKLFEKDIVSTDAGKITVEAALQQRAFGKIYIMLGINEIGYPANSFSSKYAQVVARIQELQPDTPIVLLSILHVSAAKSASDDLFTNANINARNAMIQQMADNEKVFYLDLNYAVDDESGALNAEYTGDSIHLKANCYELLVQALLEHGLVKIETPVTDPPA